MVSTSDLRKGIAIAPDNGDNADDLVRNADLALYAAKDGGRGRFHFYAQDLHAEAEARAQMEEELRDAITKGDLQLFYQPIVSTATEEITGFEALMRWCHPVKGWVSPDRFIGIAKAPGIIAQLAEWALPLLTPGGSLLALKGAKAADELAGKLNAEGASVSVHQGNVRPPGDCQRGVQEGPAAPGRVGWGRPRRLGRRGGARRGAAHRHPPRTRRRWRGR